MSDSVTFWALWAVMLFWAVGAYQRLVRMRAQAITAFASLDAQFGQYVALVKDNFSKAGSDSAPPAQAGLVGAALQFESSMKVALAHPTDAMAMRALQTAHETLRTSWVRVRNEPPDLAGDLLPEALQQQWEHISLNAGDARAEFNRRVQEYNAAIQQFPARLLARLFRFRLAHMI
jgi:LemA protein